MNNLNNIIENIILQEEINLKDYDFEYRINKGGYTNYSATFVIDNIDYYFKSIIDNDNENNILNFGKIFYRTPKKSKGLNIFAIQVFKIIAKIFDHYIKIIKPNIFSFTGDIQLRPIYNKFAKMIIQKYPYKQIKLDRYAIDDTWAFKRKT